MVLSGATSQTAGFSQLAQFKLNDAANFNVLGEINNTPAAAANESRSSSNTSDLCYS